MPELPEVETVVRALRPVLAGKTIQRLELLHPRVSRDSDAERLIAATRNARITHLDRRGKHLLWHLDGRPTLVVHLRMSGQLLLSDKPLDSPHVRAVFHLKGGPLVHFVDIRTFGTLFLLDGTEPKGYRDLGVEPLSDSFSPVTLRELMHHRTTPVKSFLLMQNFVAGIGNIYASEALWLAGIHPRTEAGAIREPKITRLHDALVKVLSDAVDQMGTTLSDFRRPNGEPGQYGNQLNVYDREGQPCPRCGQPITRIMQHGRSTFFCSRCQHTPRRSRG